MSGVVIVLFHYFPSNLVCNLVALFIYAMLTSRLGRSVFLGLCVFLWDVGSHFVIGCIGFSGDGKESVSSQLQLFMMFI